MLHVLSTDSATAKSAPCRSYVVQDIPEVMLRRISINTKQNFETSQIPLLVDVSSAESRPVDANKTSGSNHISARA